MAQTSAFDRVVSNMMARYGTTATVLIATIGAYNPDTSEVTTTDTEYAVKAIFLDLTLLGNGFMDQKNSLIQTGDKKIYIQPLHKTNPDLSMPSPQPNKDRIRVANKEYKIVAFKEVNPTMSDSILYECYVRE